jgi:hypothetical protein
MNLYFNGCSYTTGFELDDCESDRFSTLVSNHFKADHFNNAVAGSSNDQIVLRSLEFLENDSCDYAIIMLTHCERMTLNKNIFTNRNPSFYEEYYNDEVGSLNFYKNRFILEQEFEKKNIPLLLLQYYDVLGDNIYRRKCKGKIQSVARPSHSISAVTTACSHWYSQKSTNEKTLVGTRMNRLYYYNRHSKKTLCHFNRYGHKRVADYIIGELTSTI